MKNSKDAEKYINDIVKELPPSPYTMRFREELLEHMEDIEEDLISNNKNMDRIGNKDVLVKSYQDFYKACCSKFWIGELALYLILFVAIFWSGSSIIIMSYDIYESLDMKVLVAVLSVIFVFASDYAFFKLAAPRIFLFLQNKKARTLYISLILLLPFAPMVMFYSSGNGIEWNTIWSMILPIATYLASAVIGLGIVKIRRKNLFSYPQSPYVFIAIFWLLLSCSVISTYQGPNGIVWLKQIISALAFPINSLTFSLIGLLQALLYMLSAIFHFSSDMLSVFMAVGTVLAIFSLIGLSIFVFAIKSKQQSISKKWQAAIGLAVFSCGIYLFFPLGKIYEPQLVWKVPAMEVSKNIEKNEFGLFYYFSKNSYQNLLGSPYYNVCENQNAFTVINSTNRTAYELNTASLPSGKMPAMARKNSTDIVNADSQCPNYSQVPEGFACLDEKGEQLKQEALDISAGVFGYPSHCNKLTYNSKEIFEEAYNNSSGDIVEISLSDNKQWALININNGAKYDRGEPYYIGGHNLYLVDLRDTK